MKNRTNVRWLTQLALLVAILLVLNYTPLGYLQIGPLSASLLTVPVAIGAMTQPALFRLSRASPPWAQPCFRSALRAPLWSALWPVC